MQTDDYQVTPAAAAAGLLGVAVTILCRADV